MVEDLEGDAALVLRQLRLGGFESSCERVETTAQMSALLAKGEWDLIRSDYDLPEFNGHEALKILHESGLDIPFIVISGVIGKETVVEQEIREAKMCRSQRHTIESLLLAARVFESSVEGIIITDPNAKILGVNQSFVEVTGYSEMEAIGRGPNILQPERHNEDFYRHL